jgi:hypothetical protein
MQELTLRRFGRSCFSSAVSGADSALAIRPGLGGAQAAMSTHEGSGR